MEHLVPFLNMGSLALFFGRWMKGFFFSGINVRGTGFGNAAGPDMPFPGPHIL